MDWFGQHLDPSDLYRQSGLDSFASADVTAISACQWLVEPGCSLALFIPTLRSCRHEIFRRVGPYL